MRPAPPEAVLVGGSAGSLSTVLEIVGALPAEVPFALVVCLHVPLDDGGGLAALLRDRSRVPVVEVHDQQALVPAHIFVAPANYHLLVDRSRTLSLSVDPRVQYSRPSIDVLFESAARALGPAAAAVLLSGANEDGAAGLALLRAHGALTAAQEPASASSPQMPRAAVALGAAQRVLRPADLKALVLGLACTGARQAR